ncbi:hypothetical protein ACFLQ2_05565 [archaeon]
MVGHCFLEFEADKKIWGEEDGVHHLIPLGVYTKSNEAITAALSKFGGEVAAKDHMNMFSVTRGRYSSNSDARAPEDYTYLLKNGSVSVTRRKSPGSLRYSFFITGAKPNWEKNSKLVKSIVKDLKKHGFNFHLINHSVTEHTKKGLVTKEMVINGKKVKSGRGYKRTVYDGIMNRGHQRKK